MPLPRVAGREPPVRFVLEHGDARKDLPHLRELVAEVRRLGEKGICGHAVQGAGRDGPGGAVGDDARPGAADAVAGDAERRAVKAEEMFRTLMGEEVEGRSEFIIEAIDREHRGDRLRGVIGDLL